jgi:ergothioneine biosynthesis protein EgtB
MPRDDRRLTDRYPAVRAATEKLCESLAEEDCIVQSMPDVSPTKWHLAHVTWFFETFILRPYSSDYRQMDPRYEFLFNSYYEAVGQQYPRPRRGLLTRPSLREVYAYRAHVDEAMVELLRSDPGPSPDLPDLVELGIQHEQQHQELILMDIKHVYSSTPMFPVYRGRGEPRTDRVVPPLRWLEAPAGIRSVGYDGDGFCFDNERPRHDEYVAAFRLASRPATNGEFLAFLEDGGYDRSDLWLSDGWARSREEGWTEPLYWLRRGGEWFEFTLGGLVPLDLDAPVCHLSLYEADAFATWSGGRLPTEAEWESAALAVPIDGNFVEDGILHPRPPASGGRGGAGPVQMFGDVWEWTRSAYAPYPGFRPPAGAVGEYNGKFMCNQQVLRGGCCVTPRSHVRTTYRNFFYPHCRWQFAGVRLARDLD